MRPEEFIQHYGVKGMKWGVRRYQNKDGTLKEAGRKRNSDKVRELQEVSKTKKAAYKNREDKRDKDIKKMEYSHAKEDVSRQKILDKVASKEKSKRQLELESKYKAKGMNSDEATVAAYRNIRTRKILTTAAAVTLTAAVTMTARYHYKDKVDKLIKANTKFQRLTIDPNEGIRDAFYTSFKKADNVRYKGLFGKDRFTDQIKSIKKMSSITDIKQASPKMARDTFSDMYKSDKVFRTIVKDHLTSKPLTGPFTKMHDKAIASIAKGKVDKNMYELFNIGLVMDDPGSKKVSKMFYDTLAKKGYNAVKDVNDTKRAIGFGAKNPVIVFNAKDKITTDSIRKLTKREIDTAFVSTAVRDLAPHGAIYVGAFSGVEMMGSKVSAELDNNYVKNYRKENPGSKKTYTELTRMYEKQLLE